ncbi:MAG: regulatory iron-sulfur-containing complex subunit RicT [Actinomycetota bacterium]|nr:regulatory iron-sulfur-containing complex subunit RicT [Actinomycetota bacterium]
MSLIVGVIFGKNDTVHYYDPAGITLKVGDRVICNMDDGAKEIGEVIVPPVEINDSEIITPLGRVVRKATYYDLSVDELNREKEKKGFEKFNELNEKYKLKMKLVSVHVMFDKSKMIFYFTSEKRVDFREMVKELATYFKMRIELRQIGVRDEAKIVGGLGPCGMNLCCKSFLTDFESISIKMAKDQNLPLNPFKISGICGRLMCCLKYEYDLYKEFIEKAPEIGTKVKCSYGSGGVCGYEPLKKSIIVEFDNETRKSIPLSEAEVTNERVEIKGNIEIAGALEGVEKIKEMREERETVGVKEEKNNNNFSDSNSRNNAGVRSKNKFNQPKNSG